MRKHRRFLWFLFGLGSQLQLFGTSLCFTELFVYGAAIVLFSSEWPYMKRNGAMTFFWLSIGVAVNGTLSCFYNHTPFYGIIRGLAVIYLLPCAIIVCHWMLRKDMSNFKWLIIGVALSSLLSTFIFQRAVDVSMLSGGDAKNAAQGIMNGPLWMVNQLGNFGTAIPKGWYLQCPLWLSGLLPLGLAVFALFTTESGRSAALGSMGAALLIFLGGKKQSQIRRRVCNRFWLICFLGFLAIIGFKSFYKMAVTSGWLGEKAVKKYELQTRGGEGVLALLMGGRLESFVGLLACVDRPLIGFGPWAVDTKGYCQEFLSRYGNEEDYKVVAEMEAEGKVQLIQAHSCIVMFWVWYGIMGLVFWLYILFALVRYIRQDCYAVPQWYMWLAAGTPSIVWMIFFSPFGSRVPTIMIVVAVLIARAVRKGRQPLPPAMIKEIMKIEAK